MFLIVEVGLLGVNIKIMVNFPRIYLKNRAKNDKNRVQYFNHRKSEDKTLKYHFSDNIISAKFGNDIVLSPFGQAKMDSLNSCLSLVRSDFIVF